jgi:hypothetical protein
MIFDRTALGVCLVLGTVVYVGVIYLLEKITGIPFVSNPDIRRVLACIWGLVAYIFRRRVERDMERDDKEYKEREENKKKYQEALSGCNEAIKRAPNEKDRYKRRAEIYRLLAEVEMLPDKEAFYLRRANEDDVMAKKLGEGK